MDSAEPATKKEKLSSSVSSLSSHSRAGDAPREQKYRVEWEQKEEFKQWLTISRNKKDAYCKACCSVLQPRLATIKVHLKSDRHRKSMRGYNGRSNIVSLLKSEVQDLTKKAELQICAFVAEHNISLRAMDHLSEAIPKVFPDSEVAKSFSCKRTKSTALIYNVLAPELKKMMIMECQESPVFSLIIDESTDISTHNNLAIVVRFYSTSELCVKSRLLNLVDMRGSSATDLFNAIESEITKAGLKFSNMVGFAADTTNVMFGGHNSVAAKLKVVSPNCLFVKCVCHSVSLAVSSACKILPRAIEDMVRDTYMYFSHSSKRRIAYQEIQTITSTPEHKILKMCSIRWLSLGACIERILQQWEALHLYFQGEYLVDRLVVSERLYGRFSDKFNKLYFFFIDNVLFITNKLNIIFQASYSKIATVHQEISSSYKALLSRFMTLSYVKQTDIHDLDPESRENYLPLSDLYLGTKANALLSSLDVSENRDKINDFKLRAREFLISLSKSLKAKLPLDEIFHKLSFLNTQTVSNGKITSISNVAERFKEYARNSSVQDIDNEWRQLLLCPETEEIIQSEPTISVETFWGKISLLKDSITQKPLYPALGQIAKAMLSIPLSNADCERIFSSVNIIKTKSRNRLSTDAVANFIFVKEGLASGCHSFEPGSQMFKKINKDMYSNIKEHDFCLNDDDDDLFE